MRRKYLQRFWLLVALSFLIVPAIGFIVYVMQWDPAVFIFGTVLMIVIAQSPINSYRQYVKNGIMKDFTGFLRILTTGSAILSMRKNQVFAVVRKL